MKRLTKEEIRKWHEWAAYHPPKETNLTHLRNRLRKDWWLREFGWGRVVTLTYPVSSENDDVIHVVRCEGCPKCKKE